MRAKDITVLIGVLGIVLMLVVPIHAHVLDFFLIINIALAMTMLLIAMNTKDALQFSIFPSLLLITTLFRLALNVSTTRNILAEGDAGKVVAAFGTFVAGDNIAVGFVVFLILVLVQFIVITKGSERVAEVGARFTLDAMPGKQMSIDADLNSGLINETQARERRQKIEQEADFYGAMDGASKFVKGDAIASIIILFINLLGGIAIGVVMKGYDIVDAMEKYSILTIGDGLVSQIPALLISTAAGLIVTRGATEGNLASDLSGQLLAYPRLLYIVAGTLCFLGLFTPIGPISTVPTALALSFAAWRMERIVRSRANAPTEQQTEAAQVEEVRNPENVVSLLKVDPIEVEFGYGLIPLADAQQGGDLLDRIILIRRQCALDLGIVVPIVRIRDNIQLRPNEYVMKIKGNRVAKGELLIDHYLAMSPGEDDPSVRGIATTEPAFGYPALWIEEPMRDRAQIAGYTIVDPPSVLATHLTEMIKRHAHELLGRQETKALIEGVRETHPALIDELIPGVMSIGDVQKVLAKLLREKVAIRDLVTIFETLADYGSFTKDTDILTEYVRRSLSRQMTLQYVEKGDVLPVITFAPQTEKKVIDAIIPREQGGGLSLDPQFAQHIVKQIVDWAHNMLTRGQTPLLFTSPTIRMYVRQLLDRSGQDVTVLSYSEIEPYVNVHSIGVINA
ncbi:MAG: flagellar biosynthesis protein FlhA [Paenibacillaceae bacterium]|nr:flagellar biosynthesis protein FlhA [Paenibacillaceae bacterium]